MKTEYTRVIPRPLRGLPLALALVLALSVAASAADWKVDPDHSAAHFSIRHMMVAQVGGMFPAVNGTVSFDGDTPTAFAITIDVNSIDTGVAKRDAHLKTSDFFDAQAYPEMTFKSSKVEAAADGYTVLGTLTIKGVSREVSLPFVGLGESHVDPWGNTRRGGQARLTLDRRDYKVDWNAPLDGGGFMVGNDVNLVVDIEILQPK
jgi:polyisoprenoid-binding protein YceI